MQRIHRSISAISTLMALPFFLVACGGGGAESGGGGSSGGEFLGLDVEAETEAAPARLPDSVRPTAYALELTIDPAQTSFSGVAHIDVELSEPTSRIWIHGQNLEVSSVRVGELTARWESVDAEEGMARILVDGIVPAGAARIDITYSAPFDASLEGLYRVDVGADHYAFTQFESVSARKAFPSFDEPRFKTPFDITLIAPESVGAFANSLETERTSADGMARHHFAVTENLPTYLVAWAVGPLDVVEGTIAPNEVRSTPLPFRGLAPRGRGPELAYAMAHTPDIVAALERWFGIPYPFDKLDIVAVPDFAAGAMENAGLVTFRDGLLLLDEDAPVSQRRGFGFVMAHELAHQWFGNLVTMAWWDDLWLNEGFATWMETAIVAEVFPEFQAEVTELMTELEAFDADSLASARQIRQPIETRHDIFNAFDSITYSKGASVIMTIENWLGEETFQRGIRRYLSEHARGNATTADLVAALSAESGQDVGAVLDGYTLRPGIPLLETSITCAGRGPATVDFRQSRYVPTGSAARTDGLWHVPICVRYLVGREVRESCTVVEGESASLTLEGNACPTWVMPNADGGSYARFTLSDDALASLRTALAARPRRGAASPLTVRDRIALADSVRAGFRAGRISFAAAMETLSPMATSTDRFVATAPIELLSFARSHLLTDSHDAAFQRYASELYAAQLRRLGWSGRSDEDGEQRLLRAAILSFLALEAQAPAVRADARTRGLAYVEGGAIHEDAVPADLASVALAVATQEGGAEMIDTLAALLGTTNDAMVRSNLLAGLRSVDDDELRPRVLGLALDERLRLNEVFRPLMGQFSDPDGMELAWIWLTEHYEALHARIGPEYAGYLPFAASGFCSRDRIEEVRGFFGARVAETSGGPRNLESAVESIELCAALADAQRESAQTFFAR
jgi:alanyl aminopeptidase